MCTISKYRCVLLKEHLHIVMKREKAFILVQIASTVFEKEIFELPVERVTIGLNEKEGALCCKCDWYRLFIDCQLCVVT